MRKARRRSAFGIQHSEFSIGFLVFVSGRMSALPNPPCGPSTVGWRAAQGGHSSCIWGIVPVRRRDVNRYSLFRELFFRAPPFPIRRRGKAIAPRRRAGVCPRLVPSPSSAVSSISTTRKTTFRRRCSSRSTGKRRRRISARPWKNWPEPPPRRPHHSAFFADSA